MALRSVLVLHGPNLDQLGSREPDIYGTASLDDHVATVREVLEHGGVRVVDRQSASEAELVGFIHEARHEHGAIIINAGALSHYAWSLHDALRSFTGPVIEVHLSNPSAREEFRHVSVLAPVVAGSISGFGGLGYELAARAVLALSS